MIKRVLAGINCKSQGLRYIRLLTFTMTAIMHTLEKEIRQTRAFRNEYHKASVNLIYTGKWIVKLHLEIFNQYGLTLQQYNILRILRGQYPKSVTIKMIRSRMMDKMSDASRVVENLNNKGLVKRTINAQDRRKADVIITKKGLDILAQIEQHDKEMDGFLSNLTVDEAKQLNKLLDKARK